jgi:hypothetical protein
MNRIGRRTVLARLLIAALVLALDIRLVAKPSFLALG